MISQEEKFRFDLEGYLVVRNALTPEEVLELNGIIDEKYLEDYDEKGARTEFCVSQWGAPFQSLIDHPSALPYLGEFLGPKFRIDHDYMIFMIKREAHRIEFHRHHYGNSKCVLNGKSHNIATFKVYFNTPEINVMSFF